MFMLNNLQIKGAEKLPLGWCPECQLASLRSVSELYQCGTKHTSNSTATSTASTPKRNASAKLSRISSLLAFRTIQSPTSRLSLAVAGKHASTFRSEAQIRHHF